jgi:hypothetical protein
LKEALHVFELRYAQLEKNHNKELESKDKRILSLQGTAEDLQDKFESKRIFFLTV